MDIFWWLFFQDSYRMSAFAFCSFRFSTSSTACWLRLRDSFMNRINQNQIKCSVTIYVPEISVKLQLKSWPKSSAGHFLAFSFPISAWYFQDSAYLQHLNEEKTSGLMNFQFIWATVFILWLECPHPQFIHLTHFDPKCWGST